MKQVNYRYMMFFAAALTGLSLLSCSKGASTSQSQVVIAGDVTTPDGSGYDPADFSGSGQTVTFVPVSFNTMNTYVGTHPLNDPSGYLINIHLTQVDAPSDGSAAPQYYGGTIKLGYYDNSTWFQGVFDTGLGQNVDCSNCHNNGEYEARFNYFYKDSTGTKTIFTGFFQDQYGGMVLVLEPSTGSGDGDSGTYKGTLWFKNFAQSLATQSPYRKCWFITEGPYVCTSASVMNKTSYSTVSGYTKLGTFTGINLTTVLN